MSLSSNFREMGELNFEKYVEDFEVPKPESSIVVDGILNEILETAMDIAAKTSVTNDADSMQINIKHEVLPELKNIIDSLSKIDVNKVITKPAEPANLDIQMKRFLNEMMSIPRETPRNDGVGDQPIVMNPVVDVETLNSGEEVKPSKLEKKSRITDLVMNSKRVLNNLLDEEERKRQEEFEESNESVIQLIDLQPKDGKKRKDLPPELVPLPFDDSDELTAKGNEDLESIELGKGKGDDVDVEESVEVIKDDSKKVVQKKKRWNFNWKIFSFKRNRAKAVSIEK